MLEKMKAGDSLTPIWIGLKPRQIQRRLKKDQSLYARVFTALNSDKIAIKDWREEAAGLFTKMHSNRDEIGKSGLAALVYAHRLPASTAQSEQARAMQELLALHLTTASRGAVRQYIVRYKELTARLGSKLNSEWAVSALRNALVERVTDASKQIVVPVFVVNDLAEARGPIDPIIEIASLVKTIEQVAEEAARLNAAAPTNRNQRGPNAPLYRTADYNPNPNASATREPC